jgi:hypothetical protein
MKRREAAVQRNKSVTIAALKRSTGDARQTRQPDTGESRPVTTSHRHPAADLSGAMRRDAEAAQHLNLYKHEE